MKKILAFFLFGFIAGVSVFLFAMMILGGIHVDNNKISAAEAINDTRYIREAIAKNMLSGAVLDDYFYRDDEVLSISQHIKYLYRRKDGSIIVKLKSRSIMLFVPEIEDGRIIWHCFGGRDADLPLRCRKGAEWYQEKIRNREDAAANKH
jgi:hypothetical protein